MNLIPATLKSKNPSKKLRCLTERKSNIAKLLATENITVLNEVADTASFDVDKRILRLPLWEKASESVYDMLVVHEVGHALITPRREVWEPICERISPNDPLAFFPYLNIIEDIRVDATMKAKYPGCRKNYFAAHSELLESDFFGIKELNGDYSSLCLADKINIYTKVGIYNSNLNIPFSEDERAILDEALAVKTFDDVCRVAEKIWNHPSSDEKKKEQGERREGEGGGDSEDGEGQTGNPGGKKGPKTAGNAERSAKNLNREQNLDPYAKRYMEIDYRKIQPLDSDGKKSRIVSFKEILADFQTITGMVGKGDLGGSLLRELEKKNKAAISSLVSHFEQKKAAEEACRTMVSKSGVLDMTNISNYRFSEDMFLRNEIRPVGKNHGMIFMLDWSGSMSSYIRETVEQMIVLCLFCRRMNIPFSVYAFSDHGEDHNDYRDYRDSPRSEVTETNYTSGFQLLNFLSSDCNNKDFRTACGNLLWLAGKANSIGCMFPTSYDVPVGSDEEAKEKLNSKYSLSSTPLNEAIISLYSIIPAFRAKHQIEIMNTIVLTDGDASFSVVQSSRNAVIQLPNGKQYTIRDSGMIQGLSEEGRYSHDETRALANMIRKETGTNIIRIHITASSLRWGSASSSLSSGLAAHYRKHGFVAIPQISTKGFDSEFIIKSAYLEISDDDALEKIGSGMGNLKEISKTFKDGMKSAKSSRVLMGQLADLLSKRIVRKEVA